MLQDLVKQTRVVLVVGKKSSLIPYAAALGVKDFVFLPTEPSVILEVLEHPGTSESAASLLKTAMVPKKEFKENSNNDMPAKPAKPAKKSLWLFSIFQRNLRYKSDEQCPDEHEKNNMDAINDQISVQDTKERTKVLLLGVPRDMFGEKVDIVSDPLDAQIVVADINSFNFAHNLKPLIVLGTGTIADYAVKTTRPDAYIAKDVEDALTLIKQYKKETPAEEKPSEATENKVKEEPIQNKKPNLTVISSGRSSTNGHVISFNSALYVVCPSRPGKAGELTAEISKRIDNGALVCAASGSMGAISLGIPAKDLICMDWRVPGSDAPVKWDGVLVWPVDPYKFLKINENPNGLIENIKPKFPLVVVDCANEMEIVSRASNNDGIIVLYDQTVDPATSYWLKNYAGNNVFPASVSETIDIILAENGYVLNKHIERGKSTRIGE